MKLEHDASFSDREIARLNKLRDRYHTGRWPVPFAERSIDVSYGVALTAIQVFRGNSLVYECHLGCLNATSTDLAIAIDFQTCASCPEPPAALEVLRWLGLGAIPVGPDADGTQLAIMYHLMVVSPGSGIAYRGPIIHAADLSDFAEQVTQQGRHLTRLIGESGVSRLIREIVTTST